MRSALTASCKNSAFTLIELLVVIAILSILASILVPAVQDALDRGRAIHCTSNLRGISLGTNAYAHDHHGSFYRAYGGNEAPWWAESLLPYLGSDSPPADFKALGPSRDSALAALFAETAAYQCVSMPPTRYEPVKSQHPIRDDPVAVPQQPLDYALNALDLESPYPSREQRGLAPIEDVTGFPGVNRLIFYVDAHKDSALNRFNLHDFWRPSHLWDGAVPRMATDDRHGKAIVGAGIDGSARSIPFKALTKDQFYQFVR